MRSRQQALLFPHVFADIETLFSGRQFIYINQLLLSFISYSISNISQVPLNNLHFRPKWSKDDWKWPQSAQISTLRWSCYSCDRPTCESVLRIRRCSSDDGIIFGPISEAKTLLWLLLYESLTSVCASYFYWLICFISSTMPCNSVYSCNPEPFLAAVCQLSLKKKSIKTYMSKKKYEATARRQLAVK